MVKLFIIYIYLNIYIICIVLCGKKIGIRHSKMLFLVVLITQDLTDIHLALHDYLWYHMAPNGFLLAPNDYLWLSISPFGSLWLNMAPYGSLWLPKAPYSSL